MTKSIKKSKKAVFRGTKINALRAQFIYTAEIIDAYLEHYCCRGLNARHSTEPDSPEIALFSRMFKPKRLPVTREDFGWWGIPSEPANREARIYALLLAAEIMKDPKDLP